MWSRVRSVTCPVANPLASSEATRARSTSPSRTSVVVRRLPREDRLRARREGRRGDRRGAASHSGRRADVPGPRRVCRCPPSRQRLLSKVTSTTTSVVVALRACVGAVTRVGPPIERIRRLGAVVEPRGEPPLVVRRHRKWSKRPAGCLAERPHSGSAACLPSETSGTAGRGCVVRGARPGQSIESCQLFTRATSRGARNEDR